MNKSDLSNQTKPEQSIIDSDEEDFDLLIGFDVEDAKKKLFSSFNSIQLNLE